MHGLNSRHKIKITGLEEENIIVARDRTREFKEWLASDKQNIFIIFEPVRGSSSGVVRQLADPKLKVLTASVSIRSLK